MEDFYHVQIKTRSDTWVTFTSRPINGKEAAENHRQSMLDDSIFGRSISDNEIRLYKLTETEVKEELVDNHRLQFKAYLLTLPLEKIQEIAQTKIWANKEYKEYDK